MNGVTEKAFAKLNLSLDVTAQRPDGYHDLAMTMISTSLCDDLELSLRSDGVITAACSVPWLPTDERNLAIRAARAFFDETDRHPGVDIRITKRVPVGAGMAGGSTDAAAVLRALNALTGAGLSADELRRIGLSVGSDVPYCVQGGTALAKGRGEVLTPLAEMPECDIVICKPRFSISTRDLFAQIHRRKSRIRPDTDGMCRAIGDGNLTEIARRMYNVFEDVLPRGCGEIAVIRSKLLDGGALGAVMTGTGSAVFGLFSDGDKARTAYETLKKEYNDCFLTKAEKRIVL